MSRGLGVAVRDDGGVAGEGRVVGVPKFQLIFIYLLCRSKVAR